MPDPHFRLILAVILLLPLSATNALAQSKGGGGVSQGETSFPKPPAPANSENRRQYGLLVSFALLHDGEHQEGFRTLWFVIDGQGARVEAQVDGILLPRSTGFWRVGIHEAEVEKNPEWHKEDSTDSQNSIFNTSKQYAYAVPLGQNPPQKKIPESSCSEHWQTSIELVSPDFLAYETAYFRLCGMGSNDPVEESSRTLSPIDNLSQSVNLFDYFSADEKLAICASFSTPSVKKKCLAGKIQFGIAAGYLKWSVEPEEQYAGFLTKPIPVPLPTKIVGYRIRPPSDPKLRQAAAEEAGGLLSPDSEWVVSMPGYAFRVYRPGRPPTNDSDLHPLPLRFARVILAQWAMGSHVQEWDQKIKALPQSKE
jgi:hypothetical protein